jgi:hypothetical protein
MATVVFRVTQNDGVLSGAGSTGLAVSVQTTAAGLAQVTLRLGSRAGAGGNRVEAYATGFAGTAVFTASSL